MDKLFIPTKIKVGYQVRSDTYTQRLAYIIYYDAAGVLRKEKSWRNWIDKGDDGRTSWNSEKREYEIDPSRVRGPLDTHDFENKPMEGFVLNKKAGGYRSGWDHRQTYCRIYDPRGFEFEITIPNLLYILQETNSFKGKGLEGEFVYAWDGTELILLPTGCEDYQKSLGFTSLQDKRVAASDLKEGYSYKTKQDRVITYIGKYRYYRFKEKVEKTSTGEYKTQNKFGYENKFIFHNGSDFFTIPKLDVIALQMSDAVVENYGELVVEYNKQVYSNIPVELVESVSNLTQTNPYSGSWYISGLFFKKINDFVYDSYSIHCNNYGAVPSQILYYARKQHRVVFNADLKSYTKTAMDGYLNPVVKHYGYEQVARYFTREELLTYGLLDLNWRFENNNLALITQL